MSGEETQLQLGDVQHPADVVDQQAMELPVTTQGAIPTTRLGAVPVEMSYLFDASKFEHLLRVANLFSKSDLVPKHYQGKVQNCFIALQLSLRLNVEAMTVMQHTYIVHGRPAFEGKFAVALLNQTGIFKDGVRYEYSGDKDDYGCTAYGLDSKRNELVSGPKVTIAVAKAEGWWAGNKKWQTLTDLMLAYRAAAFLARLHYPHILMGLQTVEELNDLPPSEDAETVEDLNTRLSNAQKTKAPGSGKQ